MQLRDVIIKGLEAKPGNINYTPEEIADAILAEMGITRSPSPAHEIAYLALLSIPHNTELRIQAQTALAAVRDLVAWARNMDPEQVQDMFEAAPRRLP